MKKLFTLVCAIFGLTATVNAATIDDVNVCKHSYVLVFDDWDGNGTAKPGKGQLFGDGLFLDVTGGSVSTGKKSINLADESFADGKYIKYAEYGSHLNSWRLKNGQDVIAMKVTGGSKLIILGEAHASRYPEITTQAPSGNSMQGTPIPATLNTVSENGVFEWVAPEDLTIYIGSYNGDYYVSYLIVEANEAPGTPSVKVGDQKFEDGLWYREVTCTPAEYEPGLGTIVTYTTEDREPNTTDPIYKGAIKCYKDQTIKFQAYVDVMGDGETVLEEALAINADNEAIVTFKFDAPTINDEDGYVSIISEYGDAVNYYSLNGDDPVEGSFFELEESATVTAYSEIENGEYAIFRTNSVSKDVYVLNPIQEKKTIQVTAGDVVVDEEATANNENKETVYMVKNGAISADKKDFFVKNLEYAVVKDAQYQINGEERYIKMNNTNISFEVAQGDSVDVKVICSKNSCKTLNADDDPDVATDRKCYVNVSGTTYGNDDITEEGANVIEFGLAGGKIYTFQKYSGTGNIMIYSIEIAPAGTLGISNTVAADKDAEKTVKVLQDGRLIIKKGDAEFSVSGAQLK